MRKLPKVLKITLALTISLLFLFVIKLFMQIYTADVRATEAESLLQKGRIVDSFSKISEAITNNPYEPAYYRERAKIYIASTADMTTEDSFITKEAALSDLKKSYELNPKNLATVRNIIPLYYYLAIYDISKPSSANNISSVFATYTKQFFEQTSSKYSNDVGVHVLLAKYQNKLGLKEDLNTSVLKIKTLRPDLLEWHDSLRDLNVSL